MLSTFAELPGCSFDWMVTFGEFHTHWQFPTSNSSSLDQIPPLPLDKHCSLPCVPGSTFNAGLALPGYPVCDLPGSNTGNHDAVDGFSRLPFVKGDKSYGAGNPHFNDSQCAFLDKLGITGYPFDTCSAEKTFLIFDKSGNNTRLFISPSFSQYNQNVVSKLPACHKGSLEKKLIACVDDHISVDPIQGMWDGNNWDDGEDQMRENTEEIDALLFSEREYDEYEFDVSDCDNDEVTSTGRTPFLNNEGHSKDELCENLNEEVVSSDDSPKRQKLLDLSYQKMPLLDAKCAMEKASLDRYSDDAESSCSGKINAGDDIVSNKRERKVEIFKALRTLESIIPGLENTDPLIILDRVIAYLKLMKFEAESLGLGGSPSKKLNSSD